MADYYPVLKRAISSLPTSSGEARRAVYEKARAALVNQLKSYDPPLSPAEITDQRLQLEESIRRVEVEYADAAFGLSDDTAARQPQVAPAPVQPQISAPPPPPPQPPQRPYEEPVRAEARRPEPPRPEPAPPPAVEPKPAPTLGRATPTAVKPAPMEPRVPTAVRSPAPAALDPAVDAGMSALKSTREQAEELGGASAQAVQSAREAIEDDSDAPARVEPGFMEGPRPERRPRADRPVAARPPPRPARLDKTKKRSGRGPLFWLMSLLLLAVLGGGALAYLRPDLLRSAGLPVPFADTAVDETPPPETVDAPAETTAAETTPPADGLEPKILDRLPEDGAEAETPVAPDARSVQTQRVVPPTAGETPPATPDPAPAAPSETPPPAVAQPPVAATAPATPQAGDGQVLVAQRAILYEEPIPGSEGARLEGRVIWSFVNEPVLPGEPPSPQVRATVEVPDRNITLSLSIRKNSDAALPASHILELSFALPPDFSGRFIDTTPGLILKQTEDARGDPLIGAVAKVSDNLFWLALSGTPQDTPRNIALLRDRQWMDVPIRYGNRRRAILTFEKGAPGEQVFAEAFRAWGQ
ncbi:hypothetical protein [Chthonobacter albigriseus]|uniref:hypothetical protein n=1 Tax=Chthonobacter albigriseus TaxID=1683161 RepID=UPI0015EF53D7|nr:hypothetical protein [Chthonobacter albigriseus]